MMGLLLAFPRLPPALQMELWRPHEVLAFPRLPPTVLRRPREALAFSWLPTALQTVLLRHPREVATAGHSSDRQDHLRQCLSSDLPARLRCDSGEETASSADLSAS